MKRILITLIILPGSLFSMPASAGYSDSNEYTQTIRGTVTDAVTGYPLIGANVILLNSNPLVGTITDVNGHFELAAIPDFFRYMLGSRDKELVLVREEINLLKKYINLQQSRFKTNLNIAVDVPESFYHYAIPPLVLQMLVENSIKHNIISRDKPLKVSVRAGDESLVVENNLQKKSGISSTGQGLRNITERYRLFTTREVEITETSAIFKVAIPLLTLEL